MDIGSIFLILAVLIPVVVFIYRPFMERYTLPASYSEQEVSAWLAKRDQIVSALQELDDDYYLGKIPSEIYPTQRQTLLVIGADILRQIDTLTRSTPSGAAEDRLEAAILAQRTGANGTQYSTRKNGNMFPPVPDDDLEQQIASRRRLRQGKAAGFCPKCGKPVQEVDRFCPRCGAQLV
jgi:hypothetical protein